jgi:hypothetical protein
MKKKVLWTFALAVLGLTVYVGNVLATPPSGFTGTTIAKGRFGDLNAHVQSKPAHWKAKLKTKGLTDLYVQSNVWAPGGTTGWHTHPGPSLVIVTAGTLTVYDGDEPSCAPHVYSASGENSFVDVGGGDVHMISNDGTAEARTIAVQLVPADAVRRIDAPAPANCSG